MTTIQEEAPFQVISQVDYYYCQCGDCNNTIISYGNRYVRGHQNRGKKVSKSNESTKCIDCNNNTTSIRKLPSGRKVPQWYIADKEKNLYRCKKCYSKIYGIVWRVWHPDYGHVYYLLNKKHLSEYQSVWRAMNKERVRQYQRDYYFKSHQI